MPRSSIVACVAAVLLVLSATLVVGGQSAVRPTEATVSTPVQFDGGVETADAPGEPLHDWQSSPDDGAAFYGVDKRHLYYYDATTNTIRVVERPNARTFVNEGLLVGRYLAPSGQNISDYTLASREPVRYTDRGTLAVGTTFGPFVYDVSERRWASRADEPIGGYPTITTSPSGVATAGPYYVMTANSDLFLAPGDWVGHVAEPPERFETGEYPHLTSEARLAAYSDRVTKTGFPIVFRGTVGVTNEPPDQVARGSSPWAVWEDGETVRFAEPNAGPTAVYDGAGDGTVVISGSEFVAYNVTTAEAEWRRDIPMSPVARRGDTLYTHERTLDLATGETTSLYGEDGSSHVEAELNGTSVGGHFETIRRITPDGRYVALTMTGQSQLGKYRMRGVRVVDTETRTVVAQRTLLGDYESRWASDGRNYRVATTTDHALVVSPTQLYPRPGTTPDEEASVVDLETNETVSTVDFDPGRKTRVRGTEDGLFAIATVPVNDTERFGRVNGTLTVYDPDRGETVGQRSLSLAAGERVDSMRTRQGDIYVFTTGDGRTRVRAYEGVDDSLSVRASADEGGVTVSVSELSGDPVRDAVVSLNGTERRTDATGNATFDVASPAESGPTSHQLRVDAGNRTHRTQLTVTYEEVARTQSSVGGGQAATDASSPGFGWLAALLAVVGCGLWRRHRDSV
ncbi:hypothetical protein [Haloplanus sp. C73]|uniref:hypothetical protein n=1 Tax=Haloplanus sp. C73 TaxID=3421641 RepID=UPI003EB769AB